MRMLLLTCALFMLCATPGFPQGSDYKVVIDLTNPDPAFQERVVRWIELITETYPESQIGVVMYGRGFELVMTDKSTVSKEIASALTKPNVSFRVCALAMAKHEVTLDMFFKGVESVPDGIYELVQKQQAGWGYIKAAL